MHSTRRTWPQITFGIACLRWKRSARLVQAVLGGILLPWMTYRLAKRAASPLSYEVGEGGRGVSASPPLLILGRGGAGGEGLALGVAALLRQSILPWVPVLILWLVWRAWRDPSTLLEMTAGREWASRQVSTSLRQFSSSISHHLSSLVVAGVVVLACIAPFTVRNYLVYGEFLLLNSNAGYAMYSAQHPIHGTSFHEYAAAPLPQDLRDQGLNEAQWDAALAIDHLATKPTGMRKVAEGQILRQIRARLRGVARIPLCFSGNVLFNRLQTPPKPTSEEGT